MSGGNVGLDFNDTAPQEQYNVEELSAKLGACADTWVPQLFPSGRIVADELRLADITGRPPRNTGSCVIKLEGEFAGFWHDYDGGGSGGPMSTLKHATRLEGRALLQRAAEIAGVARPSPRAAQPKRDHTQEIAHILSRCVPVADTLAATYLASRKLFDPGCRDLLFNPDVTDWTIKGSPIGRPAMIAIVRDAAGNPTGGIHRTFLARDGSGKAECEKPKMMMGPVRGGAVQLFPIEDGKLGVAEGIETAIAATALYGIPCWATLSTSGMGGRSEDELSGFDLPPDVEHLFIFADGGPAGERAAQRLKMRAEPRGIQVTILLPSSGDDFNADLLQGNQPVPAAQPTPALPPALPEASNASPAPELMDTSPSSIASATAALAKDSDPGAINHVLRLVALARPDRIAQKQMLGAVKARTRLSVADLEKALRETRRTLGLAGGDKVAGDWIAKMILSETGEPKPLLENAAAAFEHAPEWQGVFGLDVFSRKIVLRRPPPWQAASEPFNERPWGDGDDIAATRWLQRAGIHVTTAVVADAVVAAAHVGSFHPVRDYLESLEWDCAPRLDTWATRLLGTEDAPYTRAVAARFLISGCARIFRPGVKADHMPILEGEQGIGKSTVLRILFDPWFSDELPDIGSKDAAMQLLGIWGLELAELDVMRRAERNRLKAWLSRTTDRFRPPFGRHVVEQPRQCVFAGTVNPEGGYLDDPTGARRFWPVRCRRVDVEGLWRERDQLWAEAFSRFRAGEIFHLAEFDLMAAAAAEQGERHIDDPWDDRIGEFVGEGSLYPKLDVSVSEILAGLAIPVDRWSRAEQLRVGSYLRRHGWERYRKRKSGVSRLESAEWRFRRVGMKDAESEDASRD